MTSNHSYFNFKFFKQIVKQNIWILALAILGFVVTQLIPMAITINYLNDESISSLSNNAYGHTRRLHDLQMLLGYDMSKLYQLFIMAFAILVGVITFSYLHSSQKTDFFHSIPVSRECIFISKYLVNLIFIIPVYILFVVIGMVIINNSDIPTADGVLKVGFPIFSVFKNIVFFLLVNAIAIFATIITGNVSIAVLLGVWFVILQDIIKMIISVLKSWFMQTVISPPSSNSSKIYSIFESGICENFFININNEEKIYLIFMYLFLALLIIVINLIAFKMRKSEASSSCIAFNFMKPVIKYLCVIIISISFGIILYSSISDSKGYSWLFFGIIFASIVTHAIIEIIYEFDFKAIFKNFVSAFICMAVSCAIMLCFKHDVLKIEYRTPNISEVAKIKVLSNWGENTMPFLSEKSVYTWGNGTDTQVNFLEDANNINLVFELHEKYLETMEFNGEYSSQLIIQYYNEKEKFLMGRSIFIDKESDEYYNLVNSKEYIENYVYFFDDNHKDIVVEQAVISNNENKIVIIHKNDYTDDFISALKLDITMNGLHIKDEEQLYKLRITSHTSTYDEYDSNEIRGSINIYESYKNTIAYIEENFELEELKVSDISNIYIWNGQENIDITQSPKGFYANTEYGFSENLSEEAVQFILDNAKPEGEIEINIWTNYGLNLEQISNKCFISQEDFDYVRETYMKGTSQDINL